MELHETKCRMFSQNVWLLHKYLLKFNHVHREQDSEWKLLSFWSQCRWCSAPKGWWWELTCSPPLHTNSFFWNIWKHTLCKSDKNSLYMQRGIIYIVLNVIWWPIFVNGLVWLLDFYFTGKHKWDSFVSISIYFLLSSTVSIFWFSTDCSFLGRCGH